MRKVSSKIEDVIKEIQRLKGQQVDLKVTRGRKKTLEISGIIENIYPSIFTVKTTAENQNSFSYSYADVLCGDVQLLNRGKEETHEEAVNNF